jgi:hypothetical protein
MSLVHHVRVKTPLGRELWCASHLSERLLPIPTIWLHFQKRFVPFHKSPNKSILGFNYHHLGELGQVAAKLLATVLKHSA